MKVKVLLLGCIAMSVALATGCGKEGGVDLAPVSGKVTMDGKALPDVVVTFSPSEKGTTMPPSVGTTDTEGRFTLRTSTGQLGAVPGSHNVMIASKDSGIGVELPDDRSLWKKPENPIPSKYQDPLKPALTISVPPKGTDAADFALESK